MKVGCSGLGEIRTGKLSDNPVVRWQSDIRVPVKGRLLHLVEKYPDPNV